MRSSATGGFSSNDDACSLADPRLIRHTSEGPTRRYLPRSVPGILRPLDAG